MEILKTFLYTPPALLISVGIEYRFAYKVLGIRFSRVLTFYIMVLVQWLPPVIV